MKKIIICLFCFISVIFSSAIANELEFKPVGGGRFIYCNNPEGIEDELVSVDNTVRFLMMNENLGPDMYYIYLSHFNYTGGGKLGYDIELDMRICAEEDNTKITIHKAFFDTPQNYAYYGNGWNKTVGETDWGQLQVCSDMLGIPMCDIRGSDFYYPREFEPVTVEMAEGSYLWLSSLLDNYQSIPFGKGVHIQALVEVESGSANMNVAAIKTRQEVGQRDLYYVSDDYADYKWDYTLKGIADTLPEVKAKINYTITDETKNGENIPVFLRNQYIPEGHTVQAWYTQLNPQNDIWSKTTAAESDILPLYYKDNYKLDYYGKNVPEDEKDNIWRFDTLHSALRKYEQQYSNTSESDFRPNFLLNTETDNHKYACNIGNYGVATTYSMSVTNETDATKYCSLVLTAASEVIAYETDLNGEKSYAYVKDLTGEKVTDNMLSHEIPPNSTEEFEFSIILPVNYNGGIKNELVITDKNIQAVNFEEKEKSRNDYNSTEVIYGNPLNEAVGNPPEIFEENKQNYEYLKGKDFSLVRWCVWDGAPEWYYNHWETASTVYILDSNNEILNSYTFPSLPCGASYSDGWFYIKTARDGICKTQDGAEWIKTDEQLPEYVPYYDLKSASDWAVSELQEGWELGLRLKKHTKDGYNFKSFISRLEFCELSALLLNKFNLAENTDAPVTFNDTSNKQIERLASAGIIEGFGDGTFRPDDPLTREQAAAILTRIIKYHAEQNSLEFDERLSEQTYYDDDSKISDWAKESVNIISACKIMLGVGENRFDPQGIYSREQSAVTILRLYKYLD